MRKTHAKLKHIAYILFAILFGPIIGSFGMLIRMYRFLRIELKGYYLYYGKNKWFCYLYGLNVFLMLMIPVFLYGLFSGPKVVIDDLVYGKIV